MTRARRLAWPGFAALLVLAACAPAESPGAASQPVAPFESCPAATAVKPTAAAAGVPMMPAVTLPCFTGGEPIDLAALGRPAVINLWASWCAPCRVELPEFQRFADAARSAGAEATPGRAGGGLLVLGVVTGDTRTGAVGAAEDAGVAFPAVFDDQESLRRALGRVGLPITLFVDAGGRVRYVYQSSEPLTQSTLESLVREHLQVVLR